MAGQFLLILLLSVSAAVAGSLNITALQKDLADVTRNFNGRVGVYVQSSSGTACRRAEERHKTGTSGSWKEVTAATNDGGILRAPDGGQVAIAVFVADSHAHSKETARIIARISAAAIAGY